MSAHRFIEASKQDQGRPKLNNATLLDTAAIAAVFATLAPAQDNAATSALAKLAKRHAEDALFTDNLENFDTLNIDVVAGQQ